MPSNERTPLLSDAQSMAVAARPDLLHAAKVIGALQAGKLPSQAQFDRAIDAFTNKNSSIISSKQKKGEGKLSDQSVLILDDIRDILLKLKTWADAKNSGDVLQEFFFQTKRASVDVDADANIDVKKPASGSEVQNDAEDLLDTLRTLAKLVLNQANILSAEARDSSSAITGEILLIARSVLADAAEEVSAVADEAAKELRPKEGESGQVSKEDLKQKGKQIQDKAKEEADKGKARADKESGPAQEKATDVKDKAVDRLIQVAKHIQKDPSYNKAFNQLFGLARKYYKKTGEAIQETAQSADVDGDLYGNEHSQKAIESFKKFIENTAGGKSTDPLVETARKVLDDIKGDERLKSYLDDVEKFISKLLEDPDYATSKAPKRDGGKLYDRGQELLQENADWKKDASALQKELESFGKAIADDKESKAIAQAFEKLGKDTKDTAKLGVQMFKGQAGAFYRDAINVVLPRILSLIKEIPIPRTEFKSKDVEFVVDNFVITSVSFVPDNLTVTTHSDFGAKKIGTAEASTTWDSTTRVRFDGLRFEAKNVSFWVRRPGAVVLSEERGLLDLSLIGKGLAGDLKLALAGEDDDQTFFKVLKSDVKLNNLSLSIHDNHHYFLSFIFGPLINAALKLALQHVLSAQISDSFEQLDWRAFDLRRRAQRYESYGLPPQQAYYNALSEPPPSQPSGPSFFAGLHSTKKGFVRDDQGPGGAQIAVGGEQLLPGKSGPRSSLERAENKAKKAADNASKQVKANAPSQRDADQAKRQAQQLRGIVEEEFNEAEETADAQRSKENGDNTWRSDVFDL